MSNQSVCNQAIIAQVLSLPIQQQEVLAICMAMNVRKHHESITDTDKQSLPLLPPDIRLLSEVSEPTFRRGRTANGKPSIQGAIVELVQNHPGMSRTDVASKVAKTIGCTYGQAYAGIGQSQSCGKTITKDGGIFPKKKK